MRRRGEEEKRRRGGGGQRFPGRDWVNTTPTGSTACGTLCAAPCVRYPVCGTLCAVPCVRYPVCSTLCAAPRRGLGRRRFPHGVMRLCGTDNISLLRHSLNDGLRPQLACSFSKCITRLLLRISPRSEWPRWGIFAQVQFQLFEKCQPT